MNADERAELRERLAAVLDVAGVQDAQVRSMVLAAPALLRASKLAEPVVLCEDHGVEPTMPLAGLRGASPRAPKWRSDALRRNCACSGCVAWRALRAAISAAEET